MSIASKPIAFTFFFRYVDYTTLEQIMRRIIMLLKITAWIIPILLAITLHEAAHAWAANRLGDDTAKRLGRLSLNPFRHVDLVGTIVVPLFIMLLSHFQFVFGWAKPVPINGNKLRSPRQDEALVAAAGPIANFIMAIMWVGCLKLSSSPTLQTSYFGPFLFLAAQAGILINLMLAFINLIPIPPLDGSRILASIMPPKYAAKYMKIEPYGFLILLALLLFQVLSLIIEPLLFWSYRLIQSFM